MTKNRAKTASSKGSSQIKQVKKAKAVPSKGTTATVGKNVKHSTTVLASKKVASAAPSRAAKDAKGAKSQSKVKVAGKSGAIPSAAAKIGNKIESIKKFVMGTHAPASKTSAKDAKKVSNDSVKAHAKDQPKNAKDQKTTFKKETSAVDGQKAKKQTKDFQPEPSHSLKKGTEVELTKESTIRDSVQPLQKEAKASRSQTPKASGVTSSFGVGRISKQEGVEAVCREVACDGLATTGAYCRLHYIKNWKKVKRKEIILSEGKLIQFIEELVLKYPDKYIEAIRQDLVNDKDFAKVIYDLELDESADDFDGEGESDDGVIDNIRRDFDDEADSF